MENACPDFAPRLITWQRAQGRHDLPWQVTDPYRIWVSEIMLQQTRVETVIPYYARFLARFPDVQALAAAPLDEVMAHWSGLGYYSRARHLHAAAQRVMEAHGGAFPREPAVIETLPGIGRSTAAAIAAFAWETRAAILDGNVKRVLTRVFGIAGWPGERAVETRLWELAQRLLPSQDLRAYTQGLMDLGATRCTRTRPRCGECPFDSDCIAHRHGRQAELPGARPRKSLPEKAVQMLALLHAGEVQLEKRPAPGIWGGLWSLPECAVETDPVALLQGRGYRISAVRELPGFVHTFSHYRLHIRPWRIDVSRPQEAGEPGRLWLPLEEVADAALPAPVRRILEGLHVR
ncbi:MAG: A/G-specific adenine glycosylase [Betaproteobacteria bacterium]|nr:A/G-specific adenine glycosylase [Betaproteobacteria bacterium]